MTNVPDVQLRSTRRPEPPGDGRRGHLGPADALAWAAAAVLSGLVALRLLRRDHHRYQIALEGSRDAALTAAPFVLVAALARRRSVLAALAAGLTAEFLRRRRRPVRRSSTSGRPDDPGCRLVTVNLLKDNPVVGELGRQLIDDRADVVAVQELTPEHLTALRDCGLLAAYPHHLLDPRPDFHGSALLSRSPMSRGSVLDVHGSGMVAADVDTPMGRLHVVSVHVVNPAPDLMITTWRDQLTWLAGYVRRHPAPLVLAGDFNATVDHRALRALLDAGVSDAHDQAGVGLGLTWPQRHWATGRGPFIPLLRLDHVLVTADLTVRRVRTAASAGSDHRRLVTEIIARSGSGWPATTLSA